MRCEASQFHCGLIGVPFYLTENFFKKFKVYIFVSIFINQRITKSGEN